MLLMPVIIEAAHAMTQDAHFLRDGVLTDKDDAAGIAERRLHAAASSFIFLILVMADEALTLSPPRSKQKMHISYYYFMRASNTRRYSRGR